MRHTRRLRLLWIGLILLGLFFVRVLAQNRDGNRLVYGSMVSSTVSEDSPLVFYTFIGDEDDQVVVRVIPTTEDFNPTLSLLSPSQQPLAINDDDPFVSGSMDARISYRLPEEGVYSLVVGGAQRSTGDFLLLIDTREAASDPTRLTVDDSVTVAFSSDPDPKTFHFDADPNSTLMLYLRAEPLTYAFLAEVRDGNWQPVAILNGSPSGTIMIQRGEGEYLLTISAPDPNGAVTVALSAGETVIVPETPPEAETTAEPLAVTLVPECSVAAPDQTVNIRSGPGTGFNTIGLLRTDESLPALGVSLNGMWYAVLFEGQRGWVADSVTNLSGNCADLPAAEDTPTPTPLPPSDTPTLTPSPTNTPTNTPTLTPSPTDTPSEAPTLTPSPTDTPTLDPVLDAPYDEDYTMVLPFYAGDTFTEQISFPGGDRTDMISVSVEGFNALNTRTEYSFRLDCVGNGTDSVAWGFDPSNPDKACGDSAVIVFTEESNDQRIIVTLPEESVQALVYYTLVVTKI
jgi:hypothetical protein